jgi:hypothetical protein
MGFIGSSFLIAGPVQIVNKKLDVHTLLYTSSFILIGFQFISFYLFSKLYVSINGLMPHQEKFLIGFHRFFQLEK